MPPYQSISKVVQYLKGKSSRKIQQEFPELRKQYWETPMGYWIFCKNGRGNVTDQMIKDYIDKHESRDDKFGNFQVEN
ncbi:MAG: transposase [Rickettsia endosymbiont of Ixodes persulcatus]|nr:transposase [Rickettsia endosymbiont of Ixodes persulcatus]MCZ6919630.1 transposase [Rickettsia endosymbiont of Ixodes persulcatus]